MGTRFKLRLYLLALFLSAGFGVLTLRLYKVQITQQDYWTRQLPGEKQVTVRVPGIRGEIKDANGIVLATNRASYEVNLDLREIYENYVNNLAPDQKVPKLEYDVKSRGMERVKEEDDIVAIVKESVLDHLDEKLYADYNANQMQIHYRSTEGLVPYTYRRDLSFEDFARFAENDYDLTGVDVTVKPSRLYVYDSLACHVLGYVKLPDIQTVSAEKRSEFQHYVADDYGGAGIEKSMDQYLQGRPGKRVLRKDEKGTIRGEISYDPPKAGADVYLTIDARIQFIAEQAMREGLGGSGRPQIGRGAVVVMDPQNGDILAMVSVPSYNPNKFIPAVSPEDWKRYNTDKAVPLFNRALSQHPPGSTFKIPIALCGCVGNKDAYRYSYYCGGGVQYGEKFMKCWIGAKGGRHGSLGLSDAIKQSCNCYFYQYGNYTGIDNIVKICGIMGLGRKTGIPLEGEAPGQVPGPEWLKMQGMQWSDAYTAMTSIGQGTAEATPLQMASVTATVANGGRVWQPRLIKKVVEKGNELRLLTVETVDGLPDTASRSVIVGRVKPDDSLHLKVFDVTGRKILDKAEADFADRAGAVAQLKTQLAPLWEVKDPSNDQKNAVIASVSSLIGMYLENVGAVLVPDEPILKYDLTKEGLEQREVDMVKQGMYMVVNAPGGTAGRAKWDVFPISGKTGTAQTGNSREPTDAWFISFAPYDKPELAVCVYVHNGDSGGKAAAPLAAHIIKQALVMKHSKDQKKYEVALKPLEEAKGHFDRILVVSYDNSSLDRFVEGDDADTLVEMPEGFIPQVASSGMYVADAPSIAIRPDSRGERRDSYKKPPPARRYTQGGGASGFFNNLFGNKKRR